MSPTVASSGQRPLTIVRRPTPVRHVISLISLCILVYAGLSIGTNSNFGWRVVGKYLFASPILLGLRLTLILTFASVAIGFLLGTLIALARLSRVRTLNVLAVLYTTVFRGVPLLVQLVFFYNLAALYPTLTIRIPFGPLIYGTSMNVLMTQVTAAIVALSLNEAAYFAEIVRSGLISVDDGQWEAAATLGLGYTRTLWRIVIPQAMRAIIPPAGNEVIGLLKGCALVSVIGVSELLFAVQAIYAQNFETIPLLLVASLWFLAVTTLLYVGQHYLERHFSRGSRRPAPRSALAQRGLNSMRQVLRSGSANDTTAKGG